MKRQLILLFSIAIFISAGLQAENISIPDSSPVFPEGDFVQWVLNHTEFPNEALADRMTGPTVISIRISAQGKVENPRVIQFPHTAIRDALLNTIKTAPDWIPASLDGKPVTDSKKFEFDLTEKLTPEQRQNMTVVTTLAEPLFLSNTQTALPLTNRSMPDFIEWINQHLRPIQPKKDQILYPCQISFVVRENGTITDVNIAECDNSTLATELRQTIEGSPKWSPALINQKNHDYTVRIKGVFRPEKKKYTLLPYTQTPPSFKKGDIETFRIWVMDRIQYPTACASRNIAGTVLVSFIVEKDGSIGEITPVQSPHKLLTQEVTRVIKLSPKWSPGLENGEPAATQLSLAIHFRNQ